MLYRHSLCMILRLSLVLLQRLCTCPCALGIQDSDVLETSVSYCAAETMKYWVHRGGESQPDRVVNTSGYLGLVKIHLATGHIDFALPVRPRQCCSRLYSPGRTAPVKCFQMNTSPGNPIRSFLHKMASKSRSTNPPSVAS